MAEIALSPRQLRGSNRGSNRLLRAVTSLYFQILSSHGHEIWSRKALKTGFLPPFWSKAPSRHESLSDRYPAGRLAGDLRRSWAPDVG
jgi:hypothetical protein